MVSKTATKLFLIWIMCGIKRRPKYFSLKLCAVFFLGGGGVDTTMYLFELGLHLPFYPVPFCWDCFRSRIQLLHPLPPRTNLIKWWIFCSKKRLRWIIRLSKDIRKNLVFGSLVDIETKQLLGSVSFWSRIKYYHDLSLIELLDLCFNDLLCSK